MPEAVGLRIDLLGAFRVSVEGRTLPRVPSVRQQHLIAFLVLNAHQTPIPRQRIAASLWPDSTDVQALTNLRRELHHLREAWSMVDALIDAGSRTLAWQGGIAAVDLSAFEAAATRGLEGDRSALQDAARLYAGDLLPDCTSEWIEADRARLHQRAMAVVARLVAELEKERAYGDALEHAQRLLRLDPLDEDAWCALMRCQARRGDRASALHTYQQCAAMLKTELGIQPGPATRATYREILELDEAMVAAPPAMRPTVYPLVGRHDEWHALRQAWQRASIGQPHLVLIRGESGIGKTRLAEELVDWCRINGVSAVTSRCYAGEGRLAYAPIAVWLRSDGLRTTLLNLQPAVLSDVARLRPDLLTGRPDVPAPDRRLDGWQRLPFFEALAQAFRAAAPLVLVVDDVHWIDADTLEWLQYFLRSAATTPCLVVATVRAEEEQDNQVLSAVLTHLERDRVVTVIPLGRLDRAASARLAGEVAGQPLDEPTLTRVFHESEGHPLFIVERGRMALVTQPSAAGPAPSEVQSLVAARLALLSDDARATAEIAAAVGRDFRFDLLQEVSDLEEDALVRALDELWRRHVVRVQHEERWDFSHDRIREVAYERIGPARKRLLHRRIAHAMERLFAGRLDEVSAPIAMHLERGGQHARAVPFLERAAAVATRVWANEEAIRCLTHALSLVDSRPPGRDRDDQELVLRSSLSAALNSARGYATPELEQNLERVFALSSADGRGQVPVRWLWAAFTLRFMLGDLKTTLHVAAQALACSDRDPACACEAHHAMGGTLMSLGRLEESQHHFELAVSSYDRDRPHLSPLGSDLGVFAHAWYSHTLWLLGDDRAALANVEEAVARARRLDDRFSETIALAYAALLHQMRLDADQVLACADRVIALCARYGFAYYGDWATALAGWARGHDDPVAGVALMQAALERLDRNRAQARRPYYLSLLAELHGRAGRRDLAAATVDTAIDMAIARDDVWWLPALYFQKSELGPADTKAVARREAVATARAQRSRALEQRIFLSGAEIV